MTTIEFIGNLATTASLVIAVIAFFAQSRRERKVATIKALDDLFDYYHNIKKSDDYGERVAFMSKCDRFAVAVNENVYDISIVRNRASKFLHDQYEKYMRDYIKQRRDQFHDEHYYSELERLIQNI